MAPNGSVDPVRLSVIDTGGGGNGSGMSRFVNQFPAAVISLSEQIENATGVNILSSLGSGKKEPASGPAQKAAETVPAG